MAQIFGVDHKLDNRFAIVGVARLYERMLVLSLEMIAVISFSMPVRSSQ
jgi:hypothetical protein